MLRVLKWDVSVDDRPHRIGGGKVLHVACQGPVDVVQVWTLETGTDFPMVDVQVFATGQPLPGSVVEFVGTTLAYPLVWHVFKVLV